MNQPMGRIYSSGEWWEKLWLSMITSWLGPYYSSSSTTWMIVVKSQWRGHESGHWQSVTHGIYIYIYIFRDTGTACPWLNGSTARSESESTEFSGGWTFLGWVFFKMLKEVLRFLVQHLDGARGLFCKLGKMMQNVRILKLIGVDGIAWALEAFFEIPVLRKMCAMVNISKISFHRLSLFPLKESLIPNRSRFFFLPISISMEKTSVELRDSQPQMTLVFKLSHMIYYMGT